MCSKMSKPTLLVSWRKHAIGWVKLNVDGSCFGNPGPYGGGGMIRDHYGNLVVCFSVAYGYGRNNEAELRAIIAVVELYKEMGFQQVEIDCDSTVMYREANRATDLIAQQGTDGLMARYMHLDQIPNLLKVLFLWINLVFLTLGNSSEVDVLALFA
ncbi:kDa ribonuclease H [Olea europaea subsp. europaea]|uniref:KDa ribonuclease H n=1 Tax=Olea europaea subsp. europaea TaxID=158383 RepID=A0A8S0TWV7_OLEEU|nr:kDa ribonuclease H [Olea europaea subsp. europaea]